MCGIAGLVVNKSARFDPRTLVEQMQKRLTHRGPDDRGVFFSDQGCCALAHTRLSILDLSAAGHQPMGLGEQTAWSMEQGAGRREQRGNSTEQGAWSKEQGAKSTELGAGSTDRRARYWITYNGEIYNYRELRRELGAGSKEHGARSGERGAQHFEFRIADFEFREQPRAGSGVSQRSAVSGQPSPVSDSAWRSNTDTEVILKAYAKWGRECVNHLRGMFAFAIWDEQERELFLARDPFGIKPLYFYQAEHTFLFASEIRALLASAIVPRKLNPEGVASYLEFGSVQDPLTIIDGVQSLLPGHCLLVKLGDRRLKTELFRCSSDPFNQTGESVPASRPEAVKLLRSKLEDSVRQHLISDVPVGAFLSGGIDSSAIVALMTKVAEQTPRTFSVVFKETEFSEASHAQLIAKTFGTEHREIMLSERDLLGMLPDALGAMDQPTMDGINTFVISKAVKEAGVTVALSGLGGDELFAGYPSFRRAKQLQKLAMFPQTVRYVAGAVGRIFLNGSSRNQKLWDLVESNCTSYAAYNISRRLFAPNEVSALLADLRPPSSDLWPHAPCSTLPAFKSAIRNSQSEIDSDVINAMSRYELQGYMANTLLRDTDQMSMAHALEIRVPFIDSVVVSFVLGLPGEWKTDGSRPKPLLLDAIGDLLPEEVWRRPKMGFTLPFQRWIQSGLRSEVAGALSSSRDLLRLGLSADGVRTMWQAFAKNPSQEPWSRPWSLYVLTKWCELNRVAA
jgi:asparagine synthase (glutamine-hydrolysing)